MPGDAASQMPALELSHVSFAYAVQPDASTHTPVLRDASLAVPEGAFALLCGDTGSGKTTLLRLAKRELAPAGELTGAVRVFGRDPQTLAPVESARLVGYVFQNPDAQVVCDTVWHEMAFGLENLGVPEGEMRRRVAETCTYLGMGPWFRARTAELSGGQRQVLALASVLAMRPRLLLLDEPTSMLDPVAEQAYLSLLFRANRELGLTVVVATHVPRAMASYATCAFELADGTVRAVDVDGLRVRPDLGTPAPVTPGGTCLSVADAWFRYGRTEPWALRGLTLSLAQGEARALVGGNGCGKTTLLRLVAGIDRPQHGSVRNRLRGSQALLPQAPQALLREETVEAEFMGWSKTARYGRGEVDAALARVGLAGARERHPLDLSGGQQQLLALEKLLLTRPRLLLLDEPTKGLDRCMRRLAAEELRRAAGEGTTLLVATHDLAFARAVCGSVSLLFDGQVASTEPTDEFLSRSWLWQA